MMKYTILKFCLYQDTGDLNSIFLLQVRFRLLSVPFIKRYLLFLDELDHEKTIKNIQAFENVIQRNTGTYPTAEIEKSRAFFVDYSTLIADNVFTTEWEEFKTDITTKTEYCLNCVSLAMHQTLMKHFEQNCEDTQQLKGYCYYIRNIKARLYNYEPILQLKNLKTTYFGKLMSIL